MRIPGKNISVTTISFFFIFVFSFHAKSQAITGVWRGKISQQRLGLGQTYQVEVKLIRNGDILTGTSYFYSSENSYNRFSVKGFIDPSTGDIVWWDEVLIESVSSGQRSTPAKNGLMYAADFNCPGEGIMKLDGSAGKKNGKDDSQFTIHLKKMPIPVFADEWDFVIENFPMVANDPSIIDSIENLKAGPEIAAKTTLPETTQNKNGIETTPPEMVRSVQEQPVKQNIEKTPVLAEKKILASAPQSIMDKFATRKKLLVTEIPVSGDSIELNFYDHAEIDGDSISLFLNNKLIYEHILLKATPFKIKLPTSELANNNELIMVAENLGSIPPNTSLMIVYVNGERHEARLESSENESAMIRFVRKQN